MGQSIKYNKGGCRHEINMVKITKEGKKIKRITAPIMAGITDCAIKQHVPIQFIFKLVLFTKSQPNS
jgi:hypothetical protein